MKYLVLGIAMVVVHNLCMVCVSTLQSAVKVEGLVVDRSGLNLGQ